MKKQNFQKNLLKLADIVEHAPPERFDMSDFVQASEEPNFCGTAMCALGWAVVSGQFEGLSWGTHAWDVKGKQNKWLTGNEADAYVANGEGSPTPTINGNPVDWDAAANEYFGPASAAKIFYGMADSDDKQGVVKALRHLAHSDECFTEPNEDDEGEF